MTLVTADDLYLFNEGRHYRLYERLGAHCVDDGVEEWRKRPAMPAVTAAHRAAPPALIARPREGPPPSVPCG